MHKLSSVHYHLSYPSFTQSNCKNNMKNNEHLGWAPSGLSYISSYLHYLYQIISTNTSSSLSLLFFSSKRVLYSSLHYLSTDIFSALYSYENFLQVSGHNRFSSLPVLALPFSNFQLLPPHSVSFKYLSPFLIHGLCLPHPVDMVVLH